MITLTSPVPDALRKIVYDCQTEDNWDDEDAIGITPEACEAAIRFLGSVMKYDETIQLPDVSP